MEIAGDRPLLRIGELSRRLGVTDHVPRAWEPLRAAPAGPGRQRFRLYSAADEGRIRQMQAYLAEGLSAAEQRAPCFARTGTPAQPGRGAGTSPRPR